ncbi:MAG: hypothetical protein LBC92_04930 [Rickettsiales bacterium]|jgi:dephospho-CoA kinase|nr:hypothetical protein [Rickettsiales bacterium]
MSYKNIISLVGMSGVGKTTFASSQNPSIYFHYSVDYVIGKYFLENDILECIKDKINSKLVYKLIKDNKLSMNANINIKDLSLVSLFLGKFGSKKLGGLDRKEFLRRQRLYAAAEKKSTMELGDIADKIFEMGYKYIINDLTGSICEVIDDKIEKFLKQTTIKYLPSSKEHIETLKNRAKKSPKPLLFSESFFESVVEKFKKEKNIKNDDNVVPDEFCIYSFPLLIENRIPKYERIAGLNV